MNASRAIAIAASTTALVVGMFIREVLPAVAEGAMLLGLGCIVVVGGWITMTAWGGRG